MNRSSTPLRLPLAAVLALAMAASPAAGDARLSALKLDVLCRGGHHSEKLAPYRLWCDGYARGIRETLAAAQNLPKTCIPGGNQQLWDRFGAWLVSNPDLRHLPATQAVLRSLRGAC